MTMESTASRPGAEPTAAKRPNSDELERVLDTAMSGDSGTEGQIWYPIAPASVSWPRVFPPL
jgi:hypothetical protein